MNKSIILIGVLLISFVFMASAGANYSQTISQYQCLGVGGNGALAKNTYFQFTDAPKDPLGDGTLTVGLIGDYNDLSPPWSEAVEVFVEGTSLGIWRPGVQCKALVTKEYPLTQSQLKEWAADGKIEVTLIQGPVNEEYTISEVNCFCGNDINIVTLEYTEAAKNSLPMQQFMKILGLLPKEK